MTFHQSHSRRALCAHVVFRFVSTDRYYGGLHCRITCAFARKFMIVFWRQLLEYEIWRPTDAGVTSHIERINYKEAGRCRSVVYTSASTCCRVTAQNPGKHYRTTAKSRKKPRNHHRFTPLKLPYVPITIAQFRRFAREKVAQPSPNPLAFLKPRPVTATHLRAASMASIATTVSQKPSKAGQHP